MPKTKETNYRLFVGVLLSEEVRSRLYSIQSAILGTCHFDGRRVPRDNLHITLSFFGSVADVEIKLLKERLSSISAEQFSLIFTDVEYIGRGRRAGLVWVRGETSLPFERLKIALTTAFGNPSDNEKNSRPHITLFRLKGRNQALRELLAQGSKFEPLTVLVKSVSLLESNATPSGVHYEELARYPLSGA